MKRALATLAAFLIVAAPAVLALRAQSADYEPASEEEWTARDAHTDALERRVEAAKRNGRDVWRQAASWPRR